jgi:hypothetical protein
MQGIFLGQKAVQELVQNQESKQRDGGGCEDDDPQLALEWMVASYLSCSKIHIELEDWKC